MPLTAVQKATLKAHIAANANQIGGVPIKDMPPTTDANVAIAGWYNQVAAPAFFVYRTAVTTAEIMSNGFDWTRVDNMTAGEARVWEFMTRLGTIDPSKANIRAGVNEAFKGTAQDDAMRLVIFGHCQKLASNVEQVLILSGSGTAATNTGVGPATPGFLGNISGDDVEAARQLP